MPESATDVELPVNHRNFMLRQMANDRASADPFPGPLNEAFCKGSIQVGEFNVRKVVASDWQTLKALDSPIIKFIQEMMQNRGAGVPDVPTTEADEWEICLQFTRTPAECRAILAKGRDEFRKVASEQIGDKVESDVVRIITACVMEQLKRGWLTALSYKAALEEKGEVTFFRDAGQQPAQTG